MSPTILPLLLAAASSGSTATPIAAETAFRGWQAAHGTNWRLFTHPDSGRVEMIAGGRSQLGEAPRDEAEALARAVQALGATHELFGIDTSTLEPVRALFLPLGQIGSGDKWTVRFAQRHAGLRVVDGAVNVLLSAEGALLSVQSNAVRELGDVATVPTLSANAAVDLAVASYRDRTRQRPSRISQAELVVVRATESAPARLAWEVDVQALDDAATAHGETHWIDAATGAVLRTAESVHNCFDVTGTVRSNATPGLAPDGASNPETQQVLRYARVQSSAGTVTTDANGVFNFPGVNTPLSCTFTYYGSWNDVQNSAGAEHSVVQSIPANSPTNVLLNPASSDQITAQANAMNGVNDMVDWIASLNPTDTTAQIRYVSNVNISSQCNAFFDGASLNYFLPGGGCPNTSYSTVVAHEQGHWLNVLYGTTNNSDGIGEGGADIWSMYLWDTPVVAQDFFGPGSPIRTGLNTRLFCGDATPSCHGGSHNNGEPWMGAAWKIRARLNTTLGDAPGDLVADMIFYGWNASYNQTQLRSIIETQWLTLDDDDGNIDNGTPHYSEIDLGFRDQGWPGVTLIPLGITNVTQLADTLDTAGPYVVQASIVANAAPPLVSRVLKWRVDDGAWNTTAMTPMGGDNYQASIPGQPALSRVQYAIEAVDSSATTVRAPKSWPEHVNVFDVGDVRQVRFDAFDGATAAGWTTGSIGDTSNPESDWQRQNPVGAGGNAGGNVWFDPTDSSSLPFCFGNDIGLGGTDSTYGANVHNYLRSPVINCASALNTRLRFRSWLTVEGNAADQARVLVNGVEFYLNPAAVRIDKEWGFQELDISSVADGNASVTVEFRLKSNGTNQLGGWNVDDVRVFYVLPPPCPPGTNYCLTSPNSATGGATMAFAGTTNLGLDNLLLIVNACPANTIGQFYYGRQTTQVAFGNGFRCVGGQTYRLPLQTTDSFGDATYDVTYATLPALGAISAGDTCYFQFWYRNAAGGGAGFNLSDGLALNFCP